MCHEALENVTDWSVEDIDIYLGLLAFERSQKQTFVPDADGSEDHSSSSAVSFAEDDEEEQMEEECKVC